MSSPKQAAVDILDECDSLLRSLETLTKREAKATMRLLEAVHYTVHIDGELLPDDTHCLNDLDLLDAVRLVLHVRHDLDYRDSETIESSPPRMRGSHE